MTPLVFENFRSDPRVKKAHELLSAALKDHQSAMDGVRPPTAGRSGSYADDINRLGELRGRPLVLPYLGSGIGNGALVELEDGSVKYDFISGIGVHFLGHSHPLMLEAAFEAAIRDTIMQGNLLQNGETLVLSRRFQDLANQNGARFSHCFLTTSGAMANENALKIALQKHHPADRIFAFEGSFAGRTLALSQITDRPVYRTGMPVTLAVDYVPFFDPARPQRSTETALAVLDRHMARFPGKHAAMVFELVLGEGGCYPGDSEFFIPLMERLHQKGIAVIADEIQTFGRTPAPFAFQHYGLDAFVDIVTVGKLTQVCATLFRDAYNPTPQLISQTFTGSTSAILAGCAILEHLTQGEFFGPDGKNADLHRRFQKGLMALADRHPWTIRGPYGIGAMVALTPFDGSPEAAGRLVNVLFEEGVIAFMAGHNPSRVRFLLPAAAVSPQDIEMAIHILERAVERVQIERNEKQ